MLKVIDDFLFLIKVNFLFFFSLIYYYFKVNNIEIYLNKTLIS